MSATKTYHQTTRNIKRINGIAGALARLNSAATLNERISAIKLTKLMLDKAGFESKDYKVLNQHASAQPKPLDHGELSIPNRLKNTDRELDKYLAQKAKEDKRESEDKRFLANERSKVKKALEQPTKEAAWVQYKEHGTAMIKKHGVQLAWLFGDSLTRNLNPRDFLRDEAKYNPKDFLKILEWYLEQSID